MTVEMDETFAAALRDLLVKQVEDAGAGSQDPWFTRPRRWIAGVMLVLAAGGGGIAYATGAWTTVPGSDAVKHLAAPVTITSTGTQTVDLGTQPAGTNAIAIRFTCLTAGDFTFADGARVHCDSASAAGTQSHPATHTISVRPGQDTTTITATASARWALTATYSTVTTTRWSVNASGQTYGTPNQHGTPDLVAVIASNRRTGYVYADQLFPPAPTMPSQAVAENNAPPRTLTVYAPDGKTPIGKFTEK